MLTRLPAISDKLGKVTSLNKLLDGNCELKAVLNIVPMILVVPVVLLLIHLLEQTL